MYKNRRGALLCVIVTLFVMLFSWTAYADYDPNSVFWQPGSKLYVVGCNECITLRSAPSTSASALNYVPKFDRVTFIGISTDGFGLVEYRGQLGYVLTRYLGWEEPEF